MPTLGSLAELVGGRIFGPAGRDATGLRIDDVAPLETAGATHLSFLANPKYASQARQSQAGALLVREPLAETSAAQVLVDDPYLALARIAAHLHPPRRFAPGVESGAHVHAAAQIDASASVCAGAVVEAGARLGARSVVGAGCHVGRDARLGADCLLHPGAKVLDGCVLGDRVILQAGAVIGSDGFGYAPDQQGRRHKIPQVGRVELGDDVEIGANTTIDRATFGVTRIGAGTKIDNLVQVAHNVLLGRDCVIVSQSGIAGSTQVGDRLVMGAQTGMVGHLRVGNDVTLGARAALAGDLSGPTVVSGAPAIPHMEWLKMTVTQRLVPQMRRQIQSLEKRLAELQAKLAD